MSNPSIIHRIFGVIHRSASSGKAVRDAGQLSGAVSTHSVQSIDNPSTSRRKPSTDTLPNRPIIGWRSRQCDRPAQPAWEKIRNYPQPVGPESATFVPSRTGQRAGDMALHKPILNPQLFVNRYAVIINPHAANASIIHRCVDVIQRCQCRRRSVQSSDIRQTIYENRQIASPVEGAADWPNRKGIVNRLPLIVNSGAWNPATIRYQNRGNCRPEVAARTVILESFDNHPTSSEFRPMIFRNPPIINRRNSINYRSGWFTPVLTFWRPDANHQLIVNLYALIVKIAHRQSIENPLTGTLMFRVADHQPSVTLTSPRASVTVSHIITPVCSTSRARSRSFGGGSCFFGARQ
jgi:hypothetical protein